MANKFANAFRRQTAEEKAAKRNERQRRANGEMGRSKTVTGSSRMDVIDKLDLSGIHGSSSECGAACLPAYRPPSIRTLY